MPSRSRGSSRSAPARFLAAILLLLAGVAGATPVLAQDLTLALETFGVGNAARPGDWVGIRLKATSLRTEPLTVELVWEVPNADGDVVENVRSLTLNPGASGERWLYGRLPPSSNATDVVRDAVYAVRAFEVDGNGRRVAEIASSRVSGGVAATPADALELDQGAALLLGDRRLGLDVYNLRPQIGGLVMSPSLIELLQPVSNVNVRDLPDRWEGLAPYAAIIWCDSSRSPAQLNEDQTAALREWVRRGGTLVIGLAPETQDVWSMGKPGAHLLEDLLPSKAPRRVDGVPVREILPLVSKYPGLRDPAAATALAIFDPTTLDRGFRALVALPSPKASGTEFLIPREGSLDGAVIGVQRQFGFGTIVVLGLDVDALNGRALQEVGIPNGDVFWSRVLGIRGDTPSARDLAVLAEPTPPLIETNQPIVSELGGGQLIARQIGLEGSAAIGVLAAAALFGGYWVLSGPLGFAGLRHFRKERHSWVLFVGVAFLFTAIAWAGGALVGTRAASMQHVTVLDQLARDPEARQPGDGVPAQRATTWFSAYLPGYGSTLIALGNADERANLLASWAPPPSGTGDTFPNRDRYVVPIDSQHAYRVPARATSADFVGRWMGVVDTSWGSLVRELNPVELQLERGASPNRMQLVGTLVHELPGALSDVKVAIVSPYRTPLARLRNGPLPLPAPETSGELPLTGFLFALRGPWRPGEALDLTKETGDLMARAGGAAALNTGIRNLYYRPIEESSVLGFGPVTENLTVEARRRFMETLGIFSMNQPPDWVRERGQTNQSARARRLVGRELDLGPWFTRPCVVITGFLDDVASPVPVQIDGDSPRSRGTVFFRWICPLDTPVDLVVPDLATIRQPAAPPAAPDPPTTP